MKTKLEIDECGICGEIKECNKIVAYGFISYWCEDCLCNQEEKSYWDV
jgi:hypothetical protein